MNQDAFNKLADAERAFDKSQFIAPVIPGRLIRVRIAGMVLHLRACNKISLRRKREAKTFQGGWGVFESLAFKHAVFIRKPSMTERKSYLDLFPALSFILCRRDGNRWLGITANKSDTRFKVDGLVPIELTEECELFDTVLARFDGQTCWFDQRGLTRCSVYLRESLADKVEPGKLEKYGLTPEDREAYEVALGKIVADEIEAARDKNEERIKDALTRAGGVYQSYVERGDSYTVEYLVGREKHKSTVKKDTLQVESAGICLAGGDKNFDLNSLVGVIRQGQQERHIVRVGRGQALTDAGYRNMYGGGSDDDYDDE